MTTAATFQCKTCDGRGRLHAPWRVCVNCNGDGEIEREVEDVYDRIGKGRALAAKKAGADFKRKAEFEATSAETEWNDILRRLDR